MHVATCIYIAITINAALATYCTLAHADLAITDSNSLYIGTPIRYSL